MISLWNLQNKINEQTKWKQTHGYSEQIDGCQMGEGLWEWVNKGEGTEKYELPDINSVMGT